MKGGDEWRENEKPRRKRRAGLEPGPNRTDDNAGPSLLSAKKSRLEAGGTKWRTRSSAPTFGVRHPACRKRAVKAFPSAA